MRALSASLIPAALVSCVLVLLGACGPKPGVSSLRRPIAPAPQLEDLLDSRRYSASTRTTLRDLRALRLANSDPAAAIRLLEQAIESNPSEALQSSVAEVAIDTARSLRKKDRERAIGYYLSALRWSHPERHIGHVHAGTIFKTVYNQASAELAAVMLEAGEQAPFPRRVRGPNREYEIRWERPAGDASDPSEFDTLHPASLLRIKGFDQRVTRDGYGGALVGYRAWSPARHAADPYMPQTGYAVPLTALVRFPSPRQAVVELRDLRAGEHFVHKGRRYPLAADLTAPVATLADAAPPDKLGLLAIFRPEKAAARTGLFLLSPYRSDRIPLVLVHGLGSNPSTWRELINACYADPAVRTKFQVAVYFYPTGYPIAKNAAVFHRSLSGFRQHFDPRGKNPLMRRTVLVGHSMGGILSSAQIRGSAAIPLSEIVKDPEEAQQMSPEQRRALSESLSFPPDRNIERVVFISSPHRGSRYASNWIGRFGSNLVSFPLSILDVTTEGLLGENANLTRTFLTKPTNSIDNLKPGSPTLTSILSRPIPNGVPYHSVMGDRGRGNGTESSDGVVDYWSSHLDGAVSEAFVPCSHSSTNHPETVTEVIRILRKHVGTPPRPAAHVSDH